MKQLAFVQVAECGTSLPICLPMSASTVSVSLCLTGTLQGAHSQMTFYTTVTNFPLIFLTSIDFFAKEPLPLDFLRMEFLKKPLLVVYTSAYV